jgi:hypothetical protein
MGSPQRWGERRQLEVRENQSPVSGSPKKSSFPLTDARSASEGLLGNFNA